MNATTNWSQLAQSLSEKTPSQDVSGIFEDHASEKELILTPLWGPQFRAKTDDKELLCLTLHRSLEQQARALLPDHRELEVAISLGNSTDQGALRLSDPLAPQRLLFAEIPRPQRREFDDLLLWQPMVTPKPAANEFVDQELSVVLDARGKRTPLLVSPEGISGFDVQFDAQREMIRISSPRQSPSEQTCFVLADIRVLGKILICLSPFETDSPTLEARLPVVPSMISSHPRGINVYLQELGVDHLGQLSAPELAWWFSSNAAMTATLTPKDEGYEFSLTPAQAEQLGQGKQFLAAIEFASA